MGQQLRELGPWWHWRSDKLPAARTASGSYVTGTELCRMQIVVDEIGGPHSASSPPGSPRPTALP